MFRIQTITATLVMGIVVLFQANCGIDSSRKRYGNNVLDDADLLIRGVVLIESGSAFPSVPFYRVRHGQSNMNVGLSLVGDARFIDGSRKANGSIGQDGAINVPSIIGGTPNNETMLYFELPGHDLPTVKIMSTAIGSVARIQSYLSDGSGIILVGPSYAVLEPELLHTQVQKGTLYSVTDNESQSGINPSQLTEDCTCVWKFNVGEISFDASCRGTVAMWVIPELGWWSPAFTPAAAGVTYYADGYKHRDQIYKISGSTCITISKLGSSPYDMFACINNLARDLGYGPPVPVPNKTFSNEPKEGEPAQYVR